MIRLLVAILLIFWAAMSACGTYTGEVQRIVFTPADAGGCLLEIYMDDVLRYEGTATGDCPDPCSVPAVKVDTELEAAPAPEAVEVPVKEEPDASTD